MAIAIALSSVKCYALSMTNQDSRTKAIETTERLLRTQGYAATGLTQIITESGSPKGSFYFLFPGGKAELAAHALERCAAAGEQAILHIGAKCNGDGRRFVEALCAAFAGEMSASDFRLGCAVQNVASEKALDDLRLSVVVRDALHRWQRALALQLIACGLDERVATTAATGFLAALEGARTLARAHRNTNAFTAVAELFSKQFEPSGRN
jgi:TetR/AcrR family transcriptional regulator, lmrAB and yxaGH operons repressor